MMDVRAPLAVVGGESRLNKTTAGSQIAVSIDSDASGNYVAVWAGDNLQGWGTSDIVLQRFNAEGTPLGREERANPDWHGDQVNPDVAVANNGSFVVTWSSGDGDSYGIFARRFAADGAPLGNVIQVNNTPDGEQGFSQVATNDATGTFVVVWASNGQDGSGWGVYGQRFAADGTKQGDEFRVNSETLYDQDHPGVAMDETGDFVVVWQSFGQEGWDLDVRAQRYAADGASQGDEFRVNTYAGSSQQNPVVVMDAAGDFVVVWESYGQDGSGTGVYAQRYAADGAARGEEFRVNSHTDGSQASAAVAMGAAGDFVVTWHGYSQDWGWGVYAQRYAADGVAQGGEFRVNTDAVYYPQTAIAEGAGGGFSIAWDAYGSGSDRDIHGQLYGEGLTEPDLIPVRVTAPAGANLGQTITVSAEIRNQGGADAGPFSGQYDLSTDKVFTRSDTPLGIPFTVSGLGAYAVYSDSRILAFPDVTHGNWYVGLLVDTTSAVTEADESNNAYRPSFDEPTIGVAALPMFGPEQQANTYTDNEQSYPAVGFDAAGNYVVVWQSADQDGSGFGIYGQRFNADGSTAGAEFRVNTATDGYQQDPCIAVAPDGRFVVAWESYGQDGSGWGVYAQRFAADGSPTGEEFRVNSYIDSDQDEPSIAIDGSGNSIIVWESSGQDAGNNGGIFAQRVPGGRDTQRERVLGLLRSLARPVSAGGGDEHLGSICDRLGRLLYSLRAAFSHQRNRCRG